MGVWYPRPKWETSAAHTQQRTPDECHTKRNYLRCCFRGSGSRRQETSGQLYSIRRNKRPLPMALTSPGLRILVFSGSDTEPTHSNHHLTITLFSVDGDVRVVVLEQRPNPSHSRHCFRLSLCLLFFVTRRQSMRGEKSDEDVTDGWCDVSMT